MYINDIVKSRTLPSQFLAKQRQRSTPLRVGTDVFKMAESRTQTVAPDSLFFADSGLAARKFGDDVGRNASLREMSYSLGKGNFSLSVGYEKDEETGAMVLMARMDDGSGKELAPVKITEDTRITREADGSYAILSGREALTAGTLTGSDGDILIRVSGADVKAEHGDVSVINFGQGGVFDGGKAQMTYLGSYSKAKFSGGSGGNVFGEKTDGDDVRLRSVFTGCSIDAGSNKNTYDGYFVGSVINGGDGKDVFSGIFSGGSVLNGNGGDDSFTGFFKDSELNGGAGKNTFAYEKGSHLQLDEVFADASLQFLNSTIDAGESSQMDGVFYRTTINLEAGEHLINGVFQDSNVNNDQANAEILAFYANGTSFVGENGSTELLVHSAAHMNVDLGDGKNTVSLGAQKESVTPSFLGGQTRLGDIRFYRSQAEAGGGSAAGVGYGTLDNNTVDVSRGITTLGINTGLEKSVRHYDATTAGSGAQENGIVHVQGEDDDKEKNIKGLSKGQRPDDLEEIYEYFGEKKRRSEGIVSRTGIDEAVRVKTPFGIDRYFQENNERLNHGKTVFLYRSRYEWQV